MSLKAELETWAAALSAYDEDNYETALQLFSQIADSSKILTNIGLIYATLGEHEAAVEQFIAATQLDQYLAVAYFQCGVSNFLLARYELAHKDFDDALLYLRGNDFINYEQLGLRFKLFAAEVLFNKGLANIYMGRPQDGMQDMEAARLAKATAEHNVIDDAIADRGDGYTVFSIPVGVLYRPAQKKIDNSKARDFLGKAKLVAAEDTNDLYTEFSGVARLKQGITPTGVFLDDGPGLSRAATLAATSPKPPTNDAGPSPGLQRAKTTINVPTDARERIRAATSPASPGAARSPGRPPLSAGAGAALARSATSVGTGAGAGAGLAGPTRGLSIRKGGSPTAGGAPRMTEFYDDYLDSYADEVAPLPPPPPGRDRVANWAKGAVAAPPPPPSGVSRARSTAAPSAYSGGSMRRRPTRRGTVRAPPSRAPSSFYGGYEEEDEEGYVSGEYDEGFEMVKIRVKLHYEDDVRGMALAPETPFEEFLDLVTGKFGVSRGALAMQFKDEDGGKVTLRDAMDYELAIETARESAKGRPEGRLEIWCANQ